MEISRTPAVSKLLALDTKVSKVSEVSANLALLKVIPASASVTAWSTVSSGRAKVVPDTEDPSFQDDTLKVLNVKPDSAACSNLLCTDPTAPNTSLANRLTSPPVKLTPLPAKSWILTKVALGSLVGMDTDRSELSVNLRPDANRV